MAFTLPTFNVTTRWWASEVYPPIGGFTDIASQLYFPSRCPLDIAPGGSAGGDPPAYLRGDKTQTISGGHVVASEAGSGWVYRLRFR